ncbi:MAG: class I adenylate-forming enzyme family protein [Actinomycetes bacterium]
MSRDGTGAEVITATDSARDQERAAGALRAGGLREGDRVALVAGSSAEYLALALGALRTGIVPVLLHPALTPEEQRVLLEDADPALVLSGDEVTGFVDAARDANASADLASFPRSRPMLYTSGTTGTPKGVWTGLLSDAEAAALALDEREAWGFHAEDVHIVASPLHHSAPMRFAAGVLLAGGTVVIPGPFDAGTFAAALAEHRPTNAFLVPAHLQRLFAHADATGSALPLDSFRRVAHAGSACPEPLKRRALDAFPAGSLWEFYGSTEGQFTVCTPEEWLERPGTVGRARPGRTLAIDEDDLIWCRVPSFARFEYWRDADRTAAAWRDGAFSVFDIGSLDADGYLFLDGRRDDLIITGGVNVYPLEVERALLGVPGVTDVSVFGAPDERWGDRVCAAIVGRADVATLHAWAREHLAPHKRPKQYVHVEAIPTNTMGKVRRSQLAEDLGVTDR